jgi:segregation and condensation protein B
MPHINLFEQQIEKGTGAPLSRTKEIKRIIEALLFSTNEPIELERFREIIETAFPIRRLELKQLIEELQDEYHEQKRSIQIDEIAGGYLLRTVKEMHSFVEMLHQNRRSEKLSKAAIEVLAIIAYKQPITRAEIDKIRGVDSSGTVSALLEREVIEVVGRLDQPGRPSQYGTTKRFLRHFGLNKIEELRG